MLSGLLKETDFLQGKDACAWRPELLADIRQASVVGLRPCSRLQAFLKENVDADDHAVDKTRLLDALAVFTAPTVLGPFRINKI